MESNYTRPVIDALNVYVTPSIIAFGLPGNIITTLVFFWTDLKKHSSSFYLGSLAVADACYLVFILISLLEFHGHIAFHSDNIACQLIDYSGSVFSNWSVWLIVAFTTERYIALAYPLHRPVLCTVRKAKIITSCLFIAACAANLHILWVIGVDVDGYCNLKEEYTKFSIVVNYLDTLLTSVLPTIFITVLNVLIGRIVSRYRENLFFHHVEDESASNSTRTQLTQYENRNERQKRRIESTVSHLSVHKPSAFRERRTMMTHSQCNITKLILLTSTSFLVLNIPSYVFRVVMFTTQLSYEKIPGELIDAQRITYVLYQANFSVNFLLYAMYGTTFRKALKTFMQQNVKAIKKILRISPQ